MRPLDLIKSPLHGIIELLQRGFNNLDVKLDSREIEQLGILIFNVMEARWRKYHTIEHVLTICDTRDPIQVIAGIFHDVVYLQIDRRIHPKLSEFLQEIKVDGEKGYSFGVPGPKTGAENDPVRVVNQIFSRTPGQIISPTSGGNEYLSALAAARVLQEKLNQWDLIKVIAGIEATIPFRKKNSSNELPGKLLEYRLRELAKLHGFSKSDIDFQNAVRSAVELANRDVIGFSFKDPAAFNSQTWQLILEGNPVFKNPMYTISQYLNALFKVEGFYEALNPDVIYQECDHPEFNNAVVQRMKDRAVENLALAREYFQMRIITNYIILAVAELTGGDTALVLFIGQVEKNERERSILVEYFLDKGIPEVRDPNRSNVVLGMLADVLYDAVHENKKKETMSSYLFVRISTNERRELFSKIKANLGNKSYYFEFLKLLDKEVCYSLINAISQMASTREKEFLELERSLNLT